MTSLTSGNPQLPFFTDNGVPYSGAITANGSTQVGLAGRISVNTALLGDPSRTIVYSTNPLTASGDTTRSDFILSQLSATSYRYSPQTGIGTTGAPFTGTLLNFAKQFISQQVKPQPPPSSWRMARCRAQHPAEENERHVRREHR
jgi:flagellar hook-associated protein 1 FlgK